MQAWRPHSVSTALAYDRQRRTHRYEPSGRLLTSGRVDVADRYDKGVVPHFLTQSALIASGIMDTTDPITRAVDDTRHSGPEVEQDGSSPEPREPVLLIAGEGRAAQAWRAELDRQGFAVEFEPSPTLGVINARESGIALIVIDITDSCNNGIHTIRTLRDEGNSATILAVTAADDSTSAVEAMESGADACADHRCTPKELAARLHALVRRQRPGALAQVAAWTIGDLRVDPAARTVRRSGRTVGLTPREFAVLVALLRRRGRVVSCKELVQDVWRDQRQPVTHTVEAVIFALRHKLNDDQSHPRYIHTVRSGGYIVL